MQSDEEPLAGGNVTPVVRVGDMVHRAAGPWTSAVHSLLRYLEARGFAGAPRVHGFDAQGREVLSFIPGEIGHYPPADFIWTEDVLTAAARLLSTYHDATLGFVPPAHAAWHAVYPDRSRHEVICHNDFAPYNVVFVDRQPRAIIDFDWAGPGPRIWDVVYAAYRFVPLSWAEDVAAAGLSDPATQARRLRQFCAAYGDMAPEAVLNLLLPRLEAICATITGQAAAGHAGFQRQLAEGHLEHYQREIATLARQQSAIARALAG